MRRLLRRLPLLAAASLLLASCAIREDGAPRDIPVDERGNFGELATGDAAEDGSRIYLLSPAAAAPALGAAQPSRDR